MASELDTGVVWLSLPITIIRPPVASESSPDRLPATHHNTKWKDDCQVSTNSLEAIPILDPVVIHIAQVAISFCDDSLQ